MAILNRPKIQSSLGLAGFFAVLAVAVYVQSNGLQEARLQRVAHEPVFTEAEKIHHFDSRLYRILSFGQLPLVVDMLWLRGLQDNIISSQFKWKEGEHPLIYYTFNLATELDPLYFDAYFAGANLLAIVRNDGRGARDLLERGNEFRKFELFKFPQKFRDTYWDHAWSLPALLTYLYLYPLRDLKSGAAAIREAASVPEAPEHLRRLERILQKPDGLYEIGEILLKILAGRETDPKIKEELQKKRETLLISHALFKINMDFKTYLKKIPSYRPGIDWPIEKWREHFNRFIPGVTDPFGGQLSVDEKGRIRTTTAFEVPYGLEGF